MITLGRIMADVALSKTGSWIVYHGQENGYIWTSTFRASVCEDKSAVTIGALGLKSKQRLSGGVGQALRLSLCARGCNNAGEARVSNVLSGGDSISTLWFMERTQHLVELHSMGHDPIAVYPPPRSPELTMCMFSGRQICIQDQPQSLQ